MTVVIPPANAPSPEPKRGVVNAVAYRNGERVASLEIEAIPAALADPGLFVWVGLFEPDEALLRRVQGALGLHDLAIEDAHRAHQRPKLEHYGDSVFMVLRTAQFVGGSERLAFGETHVFAGPRYLVTVRHGSLRSHVALRGACEAKPESLALGPGYVLYALVDFVVDQFFPILEELEDQFESIETDVFDGHAERVTTERIYDLRRDLLYLKRAVHPLVDVCLRLERLEEAMMPERIRPYIRDVQDHLLRVQESLDGLREMSASALDAHLSLLSIAQSDQTKQLAGWAAIIAVPTMVAGIYGMNFRHMPELESRLGYPAVVGGMLVVCLFLYRQFKKSGWL
jgi:magnesium transporter